MRRTNPANIARKARERGGLRLTIVVILLAAFLLVALLIALKYIKERPARGPAAGGKPAVPAQATPGPRVVIKPYCSSVVVQGPYAYVGEQAGSSHSLTVLSLSKAKSPEVVAKFPMPWIVQSLSVANGLAYASLADRGFRVVDVSRPAAPALRASSDTLTALETATSGNLVFAACGIGGLRVLDPNTSPPFRPRTVWSKGGWVKSIALKGDLAYLALAGYGLWIADVSNPSSPTLKGSCRMPGHAVHVTVSGNWAYVSDGPTGLQIVDVTDPTSPTIKGNCQIPGNTLMTAISGNYAFVATAQSRLQVVDLSRPTAPAVAGYCDTPGETVGVTVEGDRAYVAAGSGGMVILDISKPTAPKLVGAYSLPEKVEK